MNITKRTAAAVLATAISLAACGSATTTEVVTSQSSRTTAPVPDTAHPSCSADVITTAVPNEFSGNGFDRYYELVIGEQVAMRYLFQPTITQPQIEHIVRTTRWYLTDVEGTAYGADKTTVVSALAANDATMVIPDGSHVEGQDLGVPGQELYFNEIAAPGSAWYLTNDPEHRDATLEEVFHQVHDAGIGTDDPGALPDYQAALLSEAKLANADGRWASDETEWIADLTQEGSLAQEYIASVIDNYYDMFAHSAEGSYIYAYNNRADVVANDPAGTALLQQFLGDVIETEAYLDPSFTGTFTMTHDADAAYSNKSQHLRGARLTGTNPANVTGNQHDNTLRGNTANNTLDGRAGGDTVVYCNAATQYAVTTTNGTTTVTGPDGTDTLINVETIHFADQTQTIDS